jgi:hypothetical protein
VLAEVQEGAVVVVVRWWYECRKGPSWQRRANSLCVMEMKCCGFDRRSDDGGSSVHRRYVISPTLQPSLSIPTTIGMFHAFALF